MKNISYLILGLCCFLAACGSDSNELVLQWDGDNVNAPLLQPDTYEAAARFPASVTNNHTGRMLTEVSYHITSSPLQTSLKIYRGGTTSSPGQVVYEADLTGSITQNAFNVHTLSTPLEITGEDLWLSIRFQLNRPLQTVGCDPGPAVTDGDWLFQESDGQWMPLSERTPVDINWNIRGILSE